jgi:hypothetical protein
MSNEEELPFVDAVLIRRYDQSQPDSDGWYLDSFADYSVKCPYCRNTEVVSYVQSVHDYHKCGCGKEFWIGNFEELNAIENRRKGMSCDIYRSASLTDCTNGGVSSRYKTAILTGEDVPPGCFYVCNHPDTPELVLMIKKSTIGLPDYLYAVPREVLDSGRHYMFGGNFIYSSDSRFPTRHPIPIHDRVEV